jgi:hypothetical protein
LTGERPGPAHIERVYLSAARIADVESFLVW